MLSAAAVIDIIPCSVSAVHSMMGRSIKFIEPIYATFTDKMSLYCFAIAFTMSFGDIRKSILR